MSDKIEIPDDILAQLLVRLPWKPLYRFRCVSKSWRDMINSSCMVEMRSRIWSPIQTVFDISTKQTLFIEEEEEAEQLLKPLSLRENPYTKICFRNTIFSFKAAQVAAPILSSIKHHLKEVDLSNFIYGWFKAEDVEIMKLFSEALEGSVLKSLNLSFNNLGEEGVRAFGKLIRSQTSLEEVYLIHAGISEEAARAIFELLAQTDQLRVLQFHGHHHMGSEVSRLVRRCPALEDFGSMVDDEGCLALAEALQICTHLKKLDLSGSCFGLEAVIALSNSFPYFENLTEINLSYLDRIALSNSFRLEDEGAQAVADALRNSAPCLQVLGLARNGITAQGASSVAACIASKQHLVKLDLSQNQLRDDGTVVISMALENGHQELKEIDVRYNRLTRVGARAIAQSVVNKPELKLLLINGNLISDEGIHELRQMFETFPEKLDPLDDNYPDDDGINGDE